MDRQEVHRTKHGPHPGYRGGRKLGHREATRRSPDRAHPRCGSAVTNGSRSASAARPRAAGREGTGMCSYLHSRRRFRFRRGAARPRPAALPPRRRRSRGPARAPWRSCTVDTPSGSARTRGAGTQRGSVTRLSRRQDHTQPHPRTNSTPHEQHCRWTGNNGERGTPRTSRAAFRAPRRRRANGAGEGPAAPTSGGQPVDHDAAHLPQWPSRNTALDLLPTQLWSPGSEPGFPGPGSSRRRCRQPGARAVRGAGHRRTGHLDRRRFRSVPAARPRSTTQWNTHSVWGGIDQAVCGTA
ncbi:hypothetical protein UG55_102815 [Frankia sp. EI5c]|nr:hypothetical protein UG55_102815 [Frankia sp. EI5c]